MDREFGRLTVLEESIENSRKFFLCLCSCGTKKKIRADGVLGGIVQSCGCLGRERRLEGCTKHGMSTRETTTPTYQSWASMISRCSNKKRKEYEFYGARGISVCDRWLKFENFLEDMGERLKGTSIDRIDNSGNYEPSNCRWATRREQQNNMRSNVFLSFNGETHTAGEWRTIIGVSKNFFYNHLYRGWGIKEMLKEIKTI